MCAMTKPVEKSFAGLGGTNIVYDLYEPPGDPVGLILVVHGVAEHAGRYHHVADVLVGLGLRVAIPDHRGHGRSGGKRLRARDLSEFTDRPRDAAQARGGRRAGRRTSSVTAWAARSPSTTRSTTRTCSPR